MQAGLVGHAPTLGAATAYASGLWLDTPCSDGAMSLVRDKTYIDLYLLLWPHVVCLLRKRRRSATPAACYVHLCSMCD